MKMLQKTKGKAIMASVLILVIAMWEVMPVSAAQMPVKPEPESSVRDEDDAIEGKEKIENSAGMEEPEQKGEMQGEEVRNGEGQDAEIQDVEEARLNADVGEEEAAGPEEAQPVTVDADQFQTINLEVGVLTDWQQILEALKDLTPEMLANTDAGSGVLVLQLQNVGDIPAEVKESIAAGDSGYIKILQCGLGSGVSLVLNGASDMGGFSGISNTRVLVNSEKRGKKSVATTVRFESHEDIGAIASLQVNLPQCSKGTKVSVYAETVAVDEEGNVTVGENACIGNTKAGENGNVEIPIQSTANYMFVYKGAKE